MVMMMEMITGMGRRREGEGSLDVLVTASSPSSSPQSRVARGQNRGRGAITDLDYDCRISNRL